MIYTAESTGASMERTKMPNLRNSSQGGFEPGLTYNNNNIIMAGMAVVLRGWLPHRGKAQMACNYCFPTRTMF